MTLLFYWLPTTQLNIFGVGALLLAELPDFTFLARLYSPPKTQSIFRGRLFLSFFKTHNKNKPSRPRAQAFSPFLLIPYASHRTMHLCLSVVWHFWGAILLQYCYSIAAVPTPLLPQYCYSIGPVLTPVLAQYWPQYWPSTGPVLTPVLVQYWPQYWPSTGPVLAPPLKTALAYHPGN